MNEKVRLTLQVSDELNKELERLAKLGGASKADVIRQALALMKIAMAARAENKFLGIVRDSSKLDTEIVGLL
jgi:predicted transcriptional regulator